MALQVTFNQRRVDETKSLITINRVEAVEFDGVVASQTEDGWLVSGIPVVITSLTRIEGDLQVGDAVTVSGETNAEGRVEASHLIPKEGPGDHHFESTKPAINTGLPGGTHEFNHQGTKAFEGGTPGGPDRHGGPIDGDVHQTPEPTDGHWSGGGWGSTSTPQPTGGGGYWHH